MAVRNIITRIPTTGVLCLIPLPPSSSQGKLAALEGRDVFLAPATLRPETMYGQTNCFVLPEGDYGAYEVSGTSNRTIP